MKNFEQMVESFINGNKSAFLKVYNDRTPQGKVDFIEHINEYYVETSNEIMRYLLISLV